MFLNLGREGTETSNLIAWLRREELADASHLVHATVKDETSLAQDSCATPCLRVVELEITAKKWR